MGKYELKNGEIAIGVVSHGAELVSLKDCKTGTEVMWDADPAYWKRTSPVLFPLVGNYRNKEVTYKGSVYGMSQHGFARDMEFELISESEKEIWFGLSSNEETLKKYPFSFRLEIGYVLEGRSVKVVWRVKNPSDETMYFSIGGHPAFRVPIVPGEKQTDYLIAFDEKEDITTRMIGEDGLATDILTTYALDDGILPVTEHLFDHDALVIEGNQAQEVSLCTPDGTPYVTVSFDAPLFGIWSPREKMHRSSVSNRGTEDAITKILTVR